MATPADSIGLKQVGGQSYIVYRLSAGETVYAVSRKYNVSYQSIVQSNPDLNLNAMQSGQEILIPRANITAANTKPTGSHMHIVAKGETVYSIAKLYGVEVTSLQKSNPEIKDFTIQAGQVLTIPQPDAALVKTNNTSVELNTQPAEQKSTNNSTIENLTEISSTATGNSNTRMDKNKSFAQIYANYRNMELVAISEKGVATWIDASSDMKVNNERYYALHNTAPIGSIVKVRNLMNNREIYAKVIGTLSDTEVSDKIY
ncbi:MAG: LysM peptidoglycan-binding domain-containing protein, partial [Chitinophagales bacterium]